MQVHLSEQLESPLVDHVNLVVDLLVVSDFAIDYAGIVDDPTVVDLRLIDLSVH